MLFRIIKKLLLFILLCFHFFSCASRSYEWKEWNENKDYYRVFVPDTNFFYQYYFITLMDYNHNIYHLLSKERPKNIKPPFKKYEKLKHDFYYKIQLDKIDSNVLLKPKFYSDPSDVILLQSGNNDTIVIWSNDTFRVPLYKSNNIYDLYIEIME